MPTRPDHLKDIRDRLKGRIAKVGERIYLSRTKALEEHHLPAICLYAPEEDSGEALAAGGHPQFQPTHTLAIEVRVAERDGFDAEAGDLIEQVKDLLLTDPEWTGRFKPHVRWRVRQFLDRRGELTFCGEVMTITATDKRPTSFPPKALTLTGIATQVDVDGDGAPELTITQTIASGAPHVRPS